MLVKSRNWMGGNKILLLFYGKKMLFQVSKKIRLIRFMLFNEFLYEEFVIPIIFYFDYEHIFQF